MGAWSKDRRLCFDDRLLVNILKKLKKRGDIWLPKIQEDVQRTLRQVDQEEYFEAVLISFGDLPSSIFEMNKDRIKSLMDSPKRSFWLVLHFNASFDASSPDSLFFYNRLKISMSIFFNIGRNPKPDFVQINCEFISIKELKDLISSKTGVGVPDLKIRNVISSVEFAPNEYIKRGSSVSVEIAVKNYTDQPLRFHEIVSNEQLATLLEDCRFYIVKSSNEDNIQKARDCSIWATTYPNQDKFKTAFQCFKHVFILFGTNRSYELKGLAKMESQPDKIPDKSIWNGVGNIRLGGNFKLRWIRKKPLSLATIEKKLGVEAKDEILRATDGYQPDPEIAKKVAMLFELPSEPYYKLQDLVPAKKEPKGLAEDMKKSITRLNMQMANWAMNLQAQYQNAQIDQIGIPSDAPLPEPKKERLLQRDSPERSSKKKKKKSKKSKKKRRHSSDSSSSSSSSHSRSRSRSRSPSSSSSPPKKQKSSATQKKYTQ